MGSNAEIFRAMTKLYSTSDQRVDAMRGLPETSRRRDDRCDIATLIPNLKFVAKML